MMKKNSILAFAFTVLCAIVHAQTVTISFTGRDTANRHLQLDRVEVKNLAEGWQETLFWPDTVLTMHVGTGISDAGTQASHALQLSASSANPFHGTTTANLVVKEPGEVTTEITDISGRTVASLRETALQPGTHQLRVTLSATGVYFLTARTHGASVSLKLVNSGKSSQNAIEHTGYNQTFATDKGSIYNTFHLGDPMEYTGYATFNGATVESSHIVQNQSASESLTLQFAAALGMNDAQPCPGSPTIIDQDGNVYNTVQIGNQCWMKESLRVTHYSDGTAIPMGNSTSLTLPYRYCPDNDTANVATYGYLYNWPAVMHGAPCSSDNPSGVQGVCPKGWHVPSNAEYGQLISYAGTQSVYQCDNNSFFTAKAFAAQTGWRSYYDQCSPGCNPSTNDAAGFSAKAAGHYSNLGTTNHYFYAFSDMAAFWTTTDGGCNDRIYMRHIYHYGKHWQEAIQDKHCGLSVRCVRN